MRVVVDGAENSPLDLGVLQLDRTPPSISSVLLTPEGGTVVADWIQSDALSGTDPAQPVVVEVNADPGGGAGGEWVPFAEQPDPGDGRKVARTNLAGLPDGRHLVRARTRDRAGNAAEPVLGTVLADHTPPVVTDVRVARQAAGPTGIAEIAYTAVDPSPGTGLAGAPPPRVGPAGSAEDWTAPGASGPGRVAVRLPAVGLHAVTVRVSDRLGNVAVSAPITVRLPTAAQAADARVSPTPSPGRFAGEAPGAAVAWARQQARRFHRSRGVRLTARVRVARTAGAWQTLLGVADAREYSGFTSFDGAVFLGPSATGGLQLLVDARHRVRVGVGETISRADVDRMTMALAVLLHETLHATGPSAADDVSTTRSGRAFEEGFTEAATLDLLRPFVARLDVPAPLRARLAAAVARYRTGYRSEVAWARRMSARATRSAASSRRARAWRIAVADTWGPQRWTRLAVATGTAEDELRAGAPA